MQDGGHTTIDIPNSPYLASDANSPTPHSDDSTSNNDVELQSPQTPNPSPPQPQQQTQEHATTKQKIKEQLKLTKPHDFLLKLLAKLDVRDPKDARAEESKFPLEWKLPSFYSAIISFVGPFIVFILLAGLTQDDHNFPQYFNGSFGAAVTILFAMPYVQPAQPKQVILGQLISGTVSLAWLHALPGESTRYILSSLCVASSVFLMKITGTIHPPGGATAYIISSQLSPTTPWDGFFYLVMPLLVGNLILIGIALVLNNIPKLHHYPQRWI